MTALSAALLVQRAPALSTAWDNVTRAVAVVALPADDCPLGLVASIWMEQIPGGRP